MSISRYYSALGGVLVLITLTNNSKIMDSVLTTCETLKEEGNKHLQAHELQKALDSYGKAIETAGTSDFPNDKLAIYYANRAYCHIKM